MKIKKRIAIFHPQLRGAGGSEARALWMAEALKDEYEVTLLTMGEVNLDALNVYYGTRLLRDQINIISFPIPYILKNRFDALRTYKLSRYCHQKEPNFDLMISTYNVMDFGKRGIQFIADFSFDDRLRQIFDPAKNRMRSLFFRTKAVRFLYLKLVQLISMSTDDGWMNNITIANSVWSSRILRDHFGISAGVIYPPVVGNFPDTCWEKKKNGFVFLGRVVPEKGVDQLSQILKKMRQKGYPLHLHVLGSIDDPIYKKELQNISKQNKEWLFLEGLTFGKKKVDFLSGHKFGISGRRDEPFGIAVAEMIKAGMIVWVPNGGGQVEIVNHPILVFKDLQDAVRKIEKVLENQDLQVELKSHLLLQAEKFSTERFMNEVRCLVRDYFNGKI